MRVVVGAAAGAVLGLTLTGPVAAAVGADATEQPGYGGDAGRLQVRIEGSSVHVRGSGYLAGSVVVVQVGAITADVIADTFGNIDATFDVGGEPTQGDARATGTGADGASVVAATSIESERASSAGATTLAAAVIGGGIPLLVDRRRRDRGSADRLADARLRYDC